MANFAGDLSRAVRLARTALNLDPEVPYVRFYLEGHAAVLELPQLVQWEPDRNRFFSWINAKGNTDRLLAEVRRAGTAVGARPDAIIAILALAENRDWRRLEAIFDAANVAASQFCTRPLGVVLSIAQALHHRGRKHEAATLLRCAQQQTAAHSQGRMRSVEMNRAALAFARAQTLALSGRREAALHALDEAVQSGWRGFPYSAKLASYPGLDALRSTAQYSQIQQRLDQTLEAERQQVLRDLRGEKASS
jgi:hypothetical protein